MTASTRTHTAPVPRLAMRQVHLDFHTAAEIADVGRDWNAQAFARTVQAAHIDSMTVFSKCHHGFSYHPTAVGTMHPALTFDLLGAQIAALHSIGVRAPIYISVAFDELIADTHPEWRLADRTGRFVGKQPDDLTGWRQLDLASPYTDYVLAQTAEVLERYAPVDGIFFDIVRQEIHGFNSPYRKMRMRNDGVHTEDPTAVAHWAREIERDFLRRAHALVTAHSPDATVYFNSRLRPDRDPNEGSRAELPYYTHIEIESLPSQEWGYTHYPLFAGYFAPLPLPLLGMTAIFHKSWSDFGGLKPEVALHYECARMIATGAACSIGDQMHPRGALDSAAYARLGNVFAQVEALEPWVRDAYAVPEIGVLMAETGPRHAQTGRETDEGVVRALMQLHRPFQFLDKDADFTPYAALIAPDVLPFDTDLAAKVQAYLDVGGALLLTHRAGLTPTGDRFALDLGIEYRGDAPESPDFFVSGDALPKSLRAYPQVLYDRGSDVRATAGTRVLAHVGLPYFSRTPQRYMGHKQTPFDRVSDAPAVTERGRVIYCHSPLFAAYRVHAVPIYREIIGALLDRLIPARLIEAPGLPTTAEVTLMHQPEHTRTLLHLIHAVPQRRGEGIEIVEDVLPLHNVRVGVRVGHPVHLVTLAPSGEVLPHETDGDRAWVTVPDVRVHQVVVFAAT